MKNYDEYMLGMSIESSISIIKRGIKYYTARLKNELRYIRKICRRAAKGKSIGSYVEFTIHELAISSIRFQILEYLKDCREMLNKNLLAYSDNAFRLTNDEISRAFKLFYKGVYELDDLEWMMKCVECSYEIMKVVICHPGQKRKTLSCKLKGEDRYV